MILMVISLLTFALIFDYYKPDLFVSAEPYGPIGCERIGTLKVKCCQEHMVKSSTGIGFEIVNYCTECDVGPGGVKQNCSDRYISFDKVIQKEDPTTPPTTPSLPTPPTTGENIVPDDKGILEQPEQQQTPPTFTPGTTPGVLEQLEQDESLQQEFVEQQQQQPATDRATELPPAAEGSQPPIVEEEPSIPVCPEGQELNEEANICVLKEQHIESQQQITEEPEEPPQTEEEQSSE